MLVKKKINNNFAICTDSNGKEIIAYGKGIGFGKVPYELDDLSKIDQTFYDINDHMVQLSNQIPDDIFRMSSKIVDIANLYLDANLSSNLIFSLADHITFAIERKKKGLFIENPLGKDIAFLYEKELQVGQIAIDLIKNELGVKLPKKEAVNIAIHFIEAVAYSKKQMDTQPNEVMIDDIVSLLEKELEFSIDREDASYVRFVTHLEYLLKRKFQQGEKSSMNLELFEKAKNEFPSIYKVANQIGDYIYANINWLPDEEELLYLIIHINRLYARTDCYR